jgi:HlyD family secretion protein
MKRLLFWFVIGATVVGAGAAGYSHFYAPSRGAANDKYRTVAVRRGDVKLLVSSTGTVKPVLSVQVGAFVSGPIQKVLVDFNDRVKKDQVLAEVDRRTYEAQRNQSRSSLLRAKADLEQYKAKLAQAGQEWERAKKLRAIRDAPNSALKGVLGKPINAISDADFDAAKANYESAKANVDVGRAAVEQAQATLELAETNLNYTIIRSPVDGLIVDRLVDPGQTVAASFQTPQLFVVAPDLEKKVHIYASVDEADIGLIREAQRRNEPVSFTVDAYPKDAFQGNIFQVRLNPTTVSNVVTYTVVVESPNLELKLLPGMTANLSFQIEKHAGVPTVPNAALRFHPKPDEVRPADRAILDGTAVEEQSEEGEESAEAAALRRNRHHVWVADGNLLSAVEIVTGLEGKRYTEIVSGGLVEGQDVVTGLRTASSKAPSSSSPPPPP